MRIAKVLKAVTKLNTLHRVWAYRCRAKTFRACFMLLVAPFAGLVRAEPLTLPPAERPGWVARDGIVMAGSWEPLLFRVRRDGSEGYTPTPEQRAAYAREHSPEMVARLRTLGVNFVMMHCYKGFGLEAERESMADAVRFSRLCHEAGLRVGVYNYSGAFGWELLFKERPEAKDWVVLDQRGDPRTYGAATYRYFWNRNHPDARTFYRKLVRFAVEEIRTDLIHFDNYTVGPGSEAHSAERFRAYLAEQFTAEQLADMGVADPSTVVPPMTGPPDNILRRAWLEFSCRSLADSYHDMSRYARSLRKDILMECNPGGVRDRIRTPVDHGRVLQGGEAFWDEGRAPGYRNGRLESRIRTYKVARRMDNMAFAYARNPLEMAESMAFNLDCLGCICWFEYDKIVDQPASTTEVSKAIEPFVRFFHQRRDLLRDAAVVADVAVLRSFPSQLFAGPQHAQLTAGVEEAFILNRIPFQIIHYHQLGDTKKYRLLVLAGCIALADRHIEQIRAFAASGGRLCVVGPVGTHNEWMLPRKGAALEGVATATRLSAGERDSVVKVVRGLCGEDLSLSVGGPDGLCTELTEQKGRRLVHLVNYRSDGPVQELLVRLRLPAGKKAQRVTLASPTREKDIQISFEQQAGVVTFTVPSVNVYEIAVVAFP